MLNTEKFLLQSLKIDLEEKIIFGGVLKGVEQNLLIGVEEKLLKMKELDTQMNTKHGEMQYLKGITTLALIVVMILAAI